MKIAIIGAGNMGGAVARGLAQGSVVKRSDIYVSNPSTPKLEALKSDYPEINVTTNNREAAAAASTESATATDSSVSASSTPSRPFQGLGV